MGHNKLSASDDVLIATFLNGKSDHTLALFDHFIAQYKKLGEIGLRPTKTMIGITSGNATVAWITQLGKNFVHIVFPFEKPYPDNLCFIKIAQVPGDDHQFNHHFRMYQMEDVNEEVLQFMQLAAQMKQP
ncbi:hypothetical protein CLV51_1021203 [Chitinophaga niastensis]|uniref:Uncharacterized protein n=1 Tax=Chitinophaga niastensis TaxID=536980 RepID=A0A2P8HQ53_CHINA|nr:DUF5655 domain-containing protein [Chitinophaga niastensis]PSL48336.1 hypothetical protein CLV51_1021203 [Chitinophaga niastensis]